jgi:hypothetical protein
MFWTDRDFANVEPADDQHDAHDRALAARDRDDEHAPSEAFARASLSLVTPPAPPADSSSLTAVPEGHRRRGPETCIERDDEMAARHALYGVGLRSGTVRALPKPKHNNAASPVGPGEAA